MSPAGVTYVDAQLARLLEPVIAAVSEYQRGALDVRGVNRVIEHYHEAELALSRWADRGLLGDHVAFLDAEGSDAFDWWGAPERDRSAQLNEAVADRESREAQESRIRWPWSKVQRSDSSKGG
jgi:hypothetical protein